MSTTIYDKIDTKKILIEFYSFLARHHDKYLTIKTYDEWLNKNNNLIEYLKTNNTKECKDLLEIFEDKRKIIKRHNKKYLNYALTKYKDYFDDMFKVLDNNIKLDEEQRKVLLADEDNLLVIAGAGSGKTTTMIAKVKYLVDKLGYKESEIAVVSFTKKVEEEIKDKLHNGFGLKGVTVYTFHALGLEILKRSGRNINAVASEERQYKIISNYIKENLFRDKEAFTKFYDSFSDKIYNIDSSWKDFATFKQYHDYAYKKKMQQQNFDLKTYNEDQIKRRRKYLKTINGEYVRSKQEVDIANFLYMNNIEYSYEQNFEKARKDNVLYNPDFYISQLEKYNYIEHYGLSEDGNNDMFNDKQLDKYHYMVNLKQQYHNQQYNRGLFIKTYSTYNDGRGLIEHLSEKLKNAGYQFDQLREEKIYMRLKDTSEDTYIATFVDKIAIPFINLFKESNRTFDDFDMLKETITEDLKKQLDVMKDIYINYQQNLIDNHLIDFQDMIFEAYQIMPKLKEKNMGVDYKYIIIDEYQDVSKQRFDLTKKISDLFDAKVMAVGDDWQTIFSYAGADIRLFKKFTKEIENAKYLPITNTYRNSQELIDIAGEFVQKNIDQIRKRLKSNKHLDKPIEIYPYLDRPRVSADNHKIMVIDNIIDQIKKQSKKSNVLLLGRYNSDLYKLYNSRNFLIKGNNVKSNYPYNLSIEFLTVHKAKGLGCDQCIIVNAENGAYGFPSKVKDYPLISLIKPHSKESVDYPEERRLFYVALTRTKNKVYIVVPNSRVSTFIDEIKEYKNVIYHNPQ